MFSNVRNIFSAAVRNVAAAGLALMIAASPAWAQALEIGQQAPPNIIRSKLMAEGHQISSAYNQIVIFEGDETREAEMLDLANVITIDNDGDWYLLRGDTPLDTPNNFLRVEIKGVDLTYYKPNPEAHIIPPGPNEDISLIRALRERGRDVIPRSILIDIALENEETAYLAFSGKITNNAGDVVGYLDGIASETPSGEETILNLYATDMNGISENIKNGINYAASPNIMAGAIDLNTLNRSRSL